MSNVKTCALSLTIACVVAAAQTTPAAAGGRRAEKHVLTVRGALALCRAHRSSAFSVSVRGYFIERVTTLSNEGALFASAKVPLSVVRNPSRVRQYGGLPVVADLRRLRRVGIGRMPDLSWLTVSGTLSCAYRPAALEVKFWHRVASAQGPLTAPSIQPVKAVLRRCNQFVTRHPSINAKERLVRIRGYFVLTLAQGPVRRGGKGRLYSKWSPNTPAPRVTDPTPYIQVAWLGHGPTWIPSAHWMIITGKLALSSCALDATAWRRA